MQVEATSHEYHRYADLIAIPGDHQQINASLAAQVCKAWLQEKKMWRKMNGKNMHNVRWIQLHKKLTIAQSAYCLLGNNVI